jgi:hypothetical protein
MGEKLRRSVAPDRESMCMHRITVREVVNDDPVSCSSVRRNHIIKVLQRWLAGDDLPLGGGNPPPWVSDEELGIVRLPELDVGADLVKCRS